MSDVLRFLDVHKFVDSFYKGRGSFVIFNRLMMFFRMKYKQSSTSRNITQVSLDVKTTITSICEYLNERNYISITFPNGSLYILSENQNYPTCFISIAIEKQRFNMWCSGDENEVDTVVSWAKENYYQPGVLIHTAAFVDEGHIQYEDHWSLNKNVKLAKQSFYPWLTVSLTDYFDAFMRSDEPILLLFGDPGLGKSTFLRTLIHSSEGYETTLAYDKNVVGHPQLISEFYGDVDVRILAYEDVDVQLLSRDTGNLFMSSLLNNTQGVVHRTEKKVVISTNLPSIDKIDPALLRAGRCFDVLEFVPLTSEQAVIARADVGMAPKNFSHKEKWKLSEVLSEDDSVKQRINKSIQKVGITR